MHGKSMEPSRNNRFPKISIYSYFTISIFLFKLQKKMTLLSIYFTKKNQEL